MQRFIWLALVSSLCFVEMGYAAKRKKSVVPQNPDVYKIYQSAKNTKFTFRLNTYTGEVDQMQLNRNKSTVWRKLKVENMIKVDDPNVSRFEIFMSTITTRDTFMLDRVTGKTWLFRKDSKGNQFWVDFGY